MDDAAELPDVVVVSWPSDRRRYGKGLREVPVMRRLRRRVRWLVAAGMIVVLASFVTDQGLLLILGAELVVLALGVYWFVRWINLRMIIDGTLTWRFREDAVRIEGNLATELPWSQIAEWYLAGEHLIISLKPQGKMKRQLANVAPLGAFSDEQMDVVLQLIEREVGPQRQYL